MSILNKGLTVVLAAKLTTQVPVPGQPPPLQPVKIEPVAGFAVNVTAVPLGKEVAQMTGQLIPAGLEMTVPLPVPPGIIVRLKFPAIGLELNTSVTAVSLVTILEQVLPTEPKHTPPHPAKEEPAAGVAVKVTDVPVTNDAVQVPGQLIPAGFEVTTPEPVPPRLTETEYEVGVPPPLLLGEEDPPPPPHPDNAFKLKIQKSQINIKNHIFFLPVFIFHLL
ncbi:MAG: hypothetical protein HYR67_00620 [Bacteroidetes bacterium]|nr:hypothetical protein [Bacteroidota bacterium]